MRNSSSQPDASQPDYVQRVNRAIDFVLQNLERPLPLDEVASVACFSPFHFHRIFRALTGETLAQFTKRLRLERALTMLGREPERSLTAVATACGFQSSSDFSRSFKQRFGVPPSCFDVQTWRDQRRSELQETIPDPDQRYLLERLPPGENPDGFAPRRRELPPRRVAYLRVFDPYRPDAVTSAAQRLQEWAEERGCADGQWLGYMWDDPDIVDHKLCRYDVAVEAAAAEPDGEVGVLELPAMTVAELEIRGPIDLEMRALDWLFGTWLPASGFVPDEQPCFEAWIGRPFAHGVEHFELCVQLPIRPG